MATRVHWLNFLKFIIMIHFLLSPHNESHPSLPERQTPRRNRRGADLYCKSVNQAEPECEPGPTSHSFGRVAKPFMHRVEDISVVCVDLPGEDTRQAVAFGKICFGAR